jgi:colanic acid biosynthesis protein WcaH
MTVRETDPTTARPWLERSAFLDLVRLAPLVSIDLVVSDPAGRLLLGRRNNAPAKGFWFVPGGRILKGERLDAAFARVARAELGLELSRSDGRFLGVFEHLYDDNVSERGGFGTHYVVLAHAVELKDGTLPAADPQHSAYRWWPPGELLRSDQVHPYTKAYCPAGGSADLT